MSADTVYREALYRAAQLIRERSPQREIPGCKHWYVVIKNPCGPTTKRCQDCGDEVAV